MHNRQAIKASFGLGRLIHAKDDTCSRVHLDVCFSAQVNPSLTRAISHHLTDGRRTGIAKGILSTEIDCRIALRSI